MPDSDYDPGEQIAEPSDAWIESLIRRIRKIPLTEPVPLELIRRMRVHLRSLARRRIRARRDRGEAVVASVDDIGDDVRKDVHEVLLDLVQSPHGQAGIYMLLAAPIVMYAAADLFAFRLSARREAAPIREYVRGKVGGTPWLSSTGTRRSYVAAGGRRVPVRSPDETGPHPWHVAAANAVTPKCARDWLCRLDTGSDADRLAVLREMGDVGLRACEAMAPLPLWVPEPGEPRGLWPDPLPPDVDIVSTSVPPAAPARKKT